MQRLTVDCQTIDTPEYSHLGLLIVGLLQHRTVETLGYRMVTSEDSMFTEHFRKERTSSNSLKDCRKTRASDSSQKDTIQPLKISTKSAPRTVPKGQYTAHSKRLPKGLPQSARFKQSPKGLYTATENLHKERTSNRSPKDNTQRTSNNSPKDCIQPLKISAKSEIQTVSQRTIHSY